MSALSQIRVANCDTQSVTGEPWGFCKAHASIRAGTEDALVVREEITHARFQHFDS
jgi:hypothetical protein